MPSNLEHFCSSHGAREHLHVQQPTLSKQDRGSKAIQDIGVPVPAIPDGATALMTA